MPSIVTEKNATKNILDRRKDERTDGRTDGQTNRGKTVYPPPPSGSGGIIIMNRSYSYFKSYKVWPALYQISISMPPYVLLDVQWCSKTRALKLLVATSGFTEYQKIYFAHEAVITFSFDMKFEDTKGY